MKGIGKKAGSILFGVCALLLFFALWEVAARLELLVNPLFLPPFTKVLGILWRIILNGELWKHLIVSLRRSLIGYAAGVAFAVPFGLALGWFKRFGRFLNPVLQAFRNTPTLALLPVFVMFFGITEFSKIVVIFWGVIWGVLLNTIAGVRSVDPQLVRAARSMGTSAVRLFVTVVLPGSLPHIFTGMRLSATTSILILIAAEMLGASKGLGYALNFYQANMRFPEMYAYIVVMSVIGVVLNFTLERVEKRSFRWREDSK
ncbi:MAG: ABC transporter permease [Oscillospiraceae bacterium]|jgi:NitT/TauT family transport system permease protein|nr:ABC transporter permease [Oscillospiraceae bacterium]